MKKLKKILWVVACAAALGLGAGKLQAQGRGNFDPAQFRQNMLDRYKERMEVKDDAEWKLIEPAITKVMDAQRDVLSDRMRGMFGGGSRRNRSGNSDTNSTSTSTAESTTRRGNGGPFGGTPSPEAEDLQKAIDDKAAADVIKAKLAKLREASAAKEAKLTQAQDELKALLTSRQEAVAVLGGLLK